MLDKLREPINALTHFIGFLLGIAALLIMTIKAEIYATQLHVFAILIFGISLLLLYGASTIYHALKLPDKYINILRRVDHMMIFILIAGTYTPVCIISLRGIWGWGLLALVWGFAIFGIILKAVWLDAPRWLSTLIYVVMGWLVVIAFVPLEKAIPLSGIILLAAGGITYTLGALIYATKLPIFNFKMFGFHEIFHLFVIGGSLCHVIFMYNYVI